MGEANDSTPLFVLAVAFILAALFQQCETNALRARLERCQERALCAEEASDG